MPKIDSKMMQIYRDSIKSESKLGKKISEEEALLLIDRAHEITKRTVGDCFCPPETRRGSKYLSRLLTVNKKNFTPEGRMMVQQYILTGRKQMMSNTERTDLSGINNNGVMPDEGNSLVRTTRTTTSRTYTPNLNTIVEEDNTIEVPRGMGNRMSTRTIVRTTNTSTGVSGTTENLNGISGMPSRSNISRPNGSIPMGTMVGGTNGNMGTSPNGSVGTGTLVGGTSGNMGTSPSGGVGTGTFIGGTSGNMGTGPSGGVGTGTLVGGIGGTIETSLNGSIETETEVVEPNTNAPVTNVSVPGSSMPVSGVYGNMILDFVAGKSTWNCHWFPMQETKPGGDSLNNLYSENGPLDKMDKINGKGAKIYEYEHGRKAFGSGKSYSWWGHCNNASEAACLLTAPKHGVVMKTMDGGEVKFTKNDIQGLLVLVAPSLVDKTDFRGDRFNGNGDNSNDPSPELFLSVVKEWSKDGLPFVLDIDPTAQVWNFPYDKVKIYESNKPPEGFNGSGLDENLVKYYHVEMEGTGYPEKARIYDFYIQEGNGGIKSSWIKTGKNHSNPDFMWRPHPKGDLMDRTHWVLNGHSSNPKVDPQLVYDIYMQSLS